MDEIDALLSMGKIHKPQYDMYYLFEVNDFGREWLKNKEHELLMEEINPSSDLCVYAEGKRSLIKEIKVAIASVQHALHELRQQ